MWWGIFFLHSAKFWILKQLNRPIFAWRLPSSGRSLGKLVSAAGRRVRSKSNGNSSRRCKSCVVAVAMPSLPWQRQVTRMGYLLAFWRFCRTEFGRPFIALAFRIVPFFYHYSSWYEYRSVKYLIWILYGWGIMWLISQRMLIHREKNTIP